MPFETGRATLSNAEGQYVLYPLAPGPYELVVRAEGFRSERLQGIRVDVAGTVTRDLHLELGNGRSGAPVSVDVIRAANQAG